jgi:hypothetical protein
VSARFDARIDRFGYIEMTLKAFSGESPSRT